jgi:hypothetical protein
MRERYGLLLLVAACAAQPPPDGPQTASIAVPHPVASVEASPPLPDPAETRDYVGRLGTNQALSQMAPLEICVDDGKLYRTSPFRLARKNLAVDLPLRRGDAGQIAVVRGRERPLRQLLTPVGACGPDYGSDAPQAQMRSDWTSPEGGLHATWAQLDQLTYIEASEVRLVRMHEVLRHDDSTVVVRIENPMDYALDGVEVVAHYEGGPGKSMPLFRPQTLDFGPHQRREITLERRISEEWKLTYGRSRRVWYELESVDLRLSRPQIEVDAVLVLDLG